MKHDAIANYMLANPAAPLGHVAQEFGVTQGWLSIIIHSDAFQARIAEKQEQVFQETIIPLKQKVVAAAHIGVEKMAETLAHSSPISDKEFIVETTDKLLGRLDYGGNKGGMPGGTLVQQNNFYQAEKTAVEKAREAMRALQQPAGESMVEEGNLIEDGKIVSSAS